MQAEHWSPICDRPEGLVYPSRVDPTGITGPTKRQASGRRWTRVGQGLFVPAERPGGPEQRIIEQAARLPADGSRGVVTGWAALRWRGATYFDGVAPDGSLRPVELNVGGFGCNLRSTPGSLVTRRRLLHGERDVVDGMPLAPVQRALFDEIHRQGSLFQAVTAIDMAAAAGLISVWVFATYVASTNSENGAPLARHAVSLAVDESRSPRESWLRLVWTLNAGLPEPLVNQPVYDLQGRLIGIPDLFDPAAGLAAEYDGAAHKQRDRHRYDVGREDSFRGAGIECVTAVAGDSRAVVAQRIVRGRARALRIAPADRGWSLERPYWDPAPETLDARLERLGLADGLAHHPVPGKFVTDGPVPAAEEGPDVSDFPERRAG